MTEKDVERKPLLYNISTRVHNIIFCSVAPTDARYILLHREGNLHTNNVGAWLSSNTLSITARDDMAAGVANYFEFRGNVRKYSDKNKKTRNFVPPLLSKSNIC